MDEPPPTSPQPGSQAPAPLSYRRVEIAADAPDTCYRCGYPLIGIDDERPCPECGLLARRSRRTTDELHNSRPRWLRRISRGANLVLLAIVVAVAGLFAWPFAYRSVYMVLSTVMPYRLWNYGPLFGLGAGAVLLFMGVLLLASAEGYPPADRTDRRLRLALRLAAALPLVAIGLLILRGVLWLRAFRAGFVAVGRIGWWLGPFDLVLWSIAAVGCVSLPLLLFLQLRGLARRARSAHLAEHCLIVGLGTSATVLYVGGVMFVFEHARKWDLGTHWVSRSNVALVLMLVCGVAGLLFTLWSLYLLIRFAIAFRAASGQLKVKWTSDDKSIPAAEPIKS